VKGAGPPALSLLRLIHRSIPAALSQRIKKFFSGFNYRAMENKNPNGINAEFVIFKNEKIF
jgi:hypothetical protein